MPSAQVSRANNIAVGVTISATSAQSATAPSDLGSTAVDRTCLARSYSRSVEIGTTDGGAFCDTEMKMVPTRKSGTVEMELIIPAAASTLFFGTEGYYCKVTADLGTQVYTDFGIVTSTSISADLDGVITESVTITLGVSGVASFGSLT